MDIRIPIGEGSVMVVMDAKSRKEIARKKFDSPTEADIVVRQILNHRRNFHNERFGYTPTKSGIEIFHSENLNIFLTD